MSERDKMPERLTPESGLAALRAAGKPFATLFRHGTLEVEFYKPDRVDLQKSHSRDEVYVVVSGSGYFVNDGVRERFASGEVLFAAAGVEHRFEDFTDDFLTWVFFYGRRRRGGVVRNLRSKLRRVEQLAPRGECRKPLVVAPAEILPGERHAVEAMCREQAASPCLNGGCANPVRRAYSTLFIVAEGGDSCA